MAANTAYMVTKGEYADFRVLAVFDDELDALRYAHHHNITERPSRDLLADVQTIEHFAKGGWNPRHGEIINADGVIPELEAAGDPIDDTFRCCEDCG